jgi:hypothetical protein
MGTCEVCGKQATALVQDLFEIIPFAAYLVQDVQKAGDVHRFCEEHERASKITQIREGPESIRL